MKKLPVTMAAALATTALTVGVAGIASGQATNPNFCPYQPNGVCPTPTPTPTPEQVGQSIAEKALADAGFTGEDAKATYVGEVGGMLLYKPVGTKATETLTRSSSSITSLIAVAKTSGRVTYVPSVVAQRGRSGKAAAAKTTTLKGVKLAKGSTVVQRGQAFAVTTKFTSKQRSAIKKAKKPVLKVKVTIKPDGGGAAQTTTRSIKLKAR